MMMKLNHGEMNVRGWYTKKITLKYKQREKWCVSQIPKP
jgi:hypothetical protein